VQPLELKTSDFIQRVYVCGP